MLTYHHNAVLIGDPSDSASTAHLLGMSAMRRLIFSIEIRSRSSWSRCFNCARLYHSLCLTLCLSIFQILGTEVEQSRATALLSATHQQQQAQQHRSIVKLTLRHHRTHLSPRRRSFLTATKMLHFLPLRNRANLPVSLSAHPPLPIEKTPYKKLLFMSLIRQLRSLMAAGEYRMRPDRPHLIQAAASASAPT